MLKSRKGIDCAREGKIEEQGLVLYYSNQCPHTDKYAPLLAEIVRGYDMDLKLIKINSLEAARNAPEPWL